MLLPPTSQIIIKEHVDKQGKPAEYGSLLREEIGEKVLGYKVEQNPVIVTTIGMVIHCIADGLALGTSVYSTLIIPNNL